MSQNLPDQVMPETSLTRSLRASTLRQNQDQVQASGVNGPSSQSYSTANDQAQAPGFQTLGYHAQLLIGPQEPELDVSLPLHDPANASVYSQVSSTAAEFSAVSVNPAEASFVNPMGVSQVSNITNTSAQFSDGGLVQAPTESTPSGQAARAPPKLKKQTKEALRERRMLIRAARGSYEDKAPVPVTKSSLSASTSPASKPAPAKSKKSVRAQVVLGSDVQANEPVNSPRSYTEADLQRLLQEQRNMIEGRQLVRVQPQQIAQAETSRALQSQQALDQQATVRSASALPIAYEAMPRLPPSATPHYQAIMPQQAAGAMDLSMMSIYPTRHFSDATIASVQAPSLMDITMLSQPDPTRLALPAPDAPMRLQLGPNGLNSMQNFQLTNTAFALNTLPSGQRVEATSYPALDHAFSALQPRATSGPSEQYWHYVYNSIDQAVNKWNAVGYVRVQPTDPGQFGVLDQLSLQKYYASSYATASVLAQATSWLSRLQAVRVTAPRQPDMNLFAIPFDQLPVRDCVAIAQQLLIESGYAFDNLVSTWNHQGIEATFARATISSDFNGFVHLLRQELHSWEDVLRIRALSLQSVPPAQTIGFQHTPSASSEISSIQGTHETPPRLNAIRGYFTGSPSLGSEVSVARAAAHVSSSSTGSPGLASTPVGIVMMNRAEATQSPAPEGNTTAIEVDHYATGGNADATQSQAEYELTRQVAEDHAARVQIAQAQAAQLQAAQLQAAQAQQAQAHAQAQRSFAQAQAQQAQLEQARLASAPPSFAQFQPGYVFGGVSPAPPAVNPGLASAPTEFLPRSSVSVAPKVSAVTPIPNPEVRLPQQRTFIPRKALASFDGLSSTSESRRWLEDYQYLAINGSWTAAEKCRNLKIFLRGSAEAWYLQLGRSTTSSWEELEKEFKREFVTPKGTPMERYYQLVQGRGETALRYLWRLNVAARAAKISYESANGIRQHTLRFLRTLTDTDVKLSLRGRDFASMEDLKRALVTIEEQVYVPHSIEARTTKVRIEDPKSSRLKDRKPAYSTAKTYKVAPACTEASQSEDELIDFESEASASEYDSDADYESDVFQVSSAPKGGFDSKSPHSSKLPGPKRVQPKLNPAPQPQSPLPKRDKCGECGKLGHAATSCWAKLVCSECGGTGHPGDRCWRKCEACGKLHERGECEIQAVMTELERWYRAEGNSVATAYGEDKGGNESNSSDDSEATQSTDKAICLMNPTHLDPDFSYQHAFQLKPGERRGWWALHPDDDSKPAIATVRGAVCNHRTVILLDSGSTTSILSYDLARRLKLKLTREERLKVKGIGGVTTYIDARASIKLTLGLSLVYYLDIWVGNIGEGIECLLGMNFMVAAGVRLSAHNGNVHLPDEELIPLMNKPLLPVSGLELPVVTNEHRILRPGESFIVPISYGRHDSRVFELWLNRRSGWVTTALYRQSRYPVAVKVTSVGRQKVDVARRSVLAKLVEEGYFPGEDRFVRQHSRKYKEWQQLAYENETSPEFRRREAIANKSYERELPPAVERRGYPTPRSILRRSTIAVSSAVGRPVHHENDATGKPVTSELPPSTTLITKASPSYGDTNSPSTHDERQRSHGSDSGVEAIPSADATVMLFDSSDRPLKEFRVASDEVALQPAMIVASPDEATLLAAKTALLLDAADELSRKVETGVPAGETVSVKECAFDENMFKRACDQNACNKSGERQGVETSRDEELPVMTTAAAELANSAAALPGLALRNEHAPGPPPEPGDPPPGFLSPSLVGTSIRTPMEQLAWTYHVTAMADQEASQETVFYHEGSDRILLDQLKDQLAMLPDLDQLNPKADLDEADAGEQDENTPEEMAKLKRILKRHGVAFLGHGNALPEPARGVICDLDVGDATPVAQRARRIPGHLLERVFELLKRLLEAGLIEYSSSAWASPIVIVMKKNGQDIRLCIDYRLVNQLIKLMSYPLPLIDELLDNFEHTMWFLSLDMASGFWAVPMSLRAKLISAFICPLGHFQWLRMPFGLKNAPLIYQQMLDNCLWGPLRLSPAEELLVDPEVLSFLKLSINDPVNVKGRLHLLPSGVSTSDASPSLLSNGGSSVETTDQAVAVEMLDVEATSQQSPSKTSDVKATSQLPSPGISCAEANYQLLPTTDAPTEATSSLTLQTSEGYQTVFQLGRVAPKYLGPVLKRSSYIDDIAYGAASWDEMCEVLDKLMYRLRYWGISVSLPKSSFGKRSIPYLSHTVGRLGIEATPKIVKNLKEMAFPSSLKGVQSFLGSLNYYHKFIEDFSVVASVLYELTDDQIKRGRNLDRAKRAFAILKEKIVGTPLLRHPNREKAFVVIIHANAWAIAAVLGQEYDGTIQPVRYTGRTLHDAELRYHQSEKEVLALLRVLHSFYTLVVGQHIKVYTRFSVLKWLLKSRTLQGRCLQWATMLSPWSLEIHQVLKDEDGLAAILAASITPREKLDEVAADLIPLKGTRVKAPPISLEMIDENYDGYLLSFDGAAKLKSNSGSAGYVVWKLPEWRVVKAQGVHLTDVTVNEAEYNGILAGLECVKKMCVSELVVVGDSRIVIQQAQGLIACHQDHLRLLLQKYEKLAASFKRLQLIHVKREYNGSADYLTSKTLRLGASCSIKTGEELELLCNLNRIHERVLKPVGSHSDRPVQSTTAFRVTTRARQAEATVVEGVQAEATHVDSNSREATNVQEQAADERRRRMSQNQDGDPELRKIKLYLRGDLTQLSTKDVRNIVKIADRYVLDADGTLLYLSKAAKGRPRVDFESARVVAPSNLRADILHQYHDDMQGGHQGINRTFERLRQEFHWIGMYADVEKHVRNCVDCETGKGAPRNPGPSPGNILATYPFQAVSMDFVLPLAPSSRGNTALLLFQCMFSGYCMCKPMSSTTAQDVAEAYEEMVFRRFGASSIIRHDRDPRFMSEVFNCFREMMGSRQRATLAYRPQANGQQERSVQTVVNSIRAYIAAPNQDDWDEIVEKLMWALNNSFDATRKETPFFLVHGWDAKTTMAAMMTKPPRPVDQLSAYLWRIKAQRQYEYAVSWARKLQSKAKKRRAEAQTQAWEKLTDRLKQGYEVGDAVWLYLPRVRPGLSKKLAHLWHGPFRIVEKSSDFRCKLKIPGTDYRVYPWVHVSRLKPRALEPERPQAEMLQVPVDSDFDAALLPEDSWEADELAGEFEVEAIHDVRWLKKSRTSRRAKEYQVKWKGYDDLDWIPVQKLNCGRLLYEFDQGAKARARFQAMQSSDEGASDL